MSAGPDSSGEFEDYVYDVRNLDSRILNTKQVHTKIMAKDVNAGYHIDGININSGVVFSNIDTQMFFDRFEKEHPLYSSTDAYAIGLSSRNDDEHNTIISVELSTGSRFELGRGKVTSEDFVSLMSSWGIYINMSPNFGSVTYYIDDTFSTTNTITITEAETVSELCGTTNEWTVDVAGTEIQNTHIKSVKLNDAVTKLPDNFLSLCSRLTDVDISDAQITTIPTKFLSGCGAINAPIVIPKTVTTIGNWFMLNCSSFNSAIILPEGLESIGTYFMRECYNYNQTLNLPSTLRTIGTQFMAFCTRYNQDLTLPALTSIGTYFLYQCTSMISAVNVGNLDASIASTSNYSFATYTSTAACYTTGITIKGAQRSAWISRFPNRTSSPYRKLINGGS